MNTLTVRLLLLICKIHKLESRSIDFVLAFPQAELEEDIWMELPLGVSVGEEYEGEYHGYFGSMVKLIISRKRAMEVCTRTDCCARLE